jgi:hypothetical protein
LITTAVDNNMQDNFFKKIDAQKEIDKTVQDYLGSSAFSNRKITDTPRDKNQVVPMGFVTMNGTSANRPTSSIVGQFYYDTSLGNGKPIYWNGTGFVDAAGNYV